MSAKKTGGSLGRRRAADQARAKFMADHGIKRTQFRDPITGAMRPLGAYPGMAGKMKAE